jgi:TolB-like protein
VNAKPSFFAELQRRHVYKVGAMYAVAGWLLVQVITQVFPIFEISALVQRILVLAIITGFPVALALAWLFDITPEGIVRTGGLPASGESPAAVRERRGTDRKLNYVLASLLLMALGYFIAERLGYIRGGAPPQAGEEKSIAVLPFANMSGDAANDYFSDGISEQILDVLARVPGLHVAARTSSFSFKGKTLDVPDIARALNVRMVLEGSVRKQDDRVRVTAQLIDAATGFHLWSETYDRQLHDIFAIQDEIATAIGDELKVKLGDARAEGQHRAGTANLQAYDWYLRGIALWSQRTHDTIGQVIHAFEQATATDPQYAQGYAGLALAYSVASDYSNRISYSDSVARARDAAERAIALDPTLPEPYAALGVIAQREVRRDTSAALLRRSIALGPSFATAYQWLGTLLSSSGDLAGGLEMLERASALDPRSPIVSQNHSFALQALGRYADSKALCEHPLDVDPDYEVCLEDVGMDELLLGQYDQARATLQHLAAVQNPSAAGQGNELVAALTGHGDRHALALRYARLALDSENEPGSGNALEGYYIPALLVMLGEHDLALDFLERLAGFAGGTADWAIVLPALDPIRCEPRFIAIVQRLKMHDPHAEKVCAGRVLQ